MLALRLKPRARKDLDGIWLHSTQEWGRDRAEAYVRAIDKAFAFLASNPGIARDAGAIRPRLLKYSVGSHVIFCRVSDGTLIVVRILHQKMDFVRHL
jgi:toxin ParE1/3/4